MESDLYNGEIYDARLEKDGWDRAGYKDDRWKRVRRVDHSKEILVASEGPPIRRIREIRPAGVFQTPSGDTVVDMGQNMVGRIRLRAKGEAGTRVTLRHAEVLDREGNFYTKWLKDLAADQQPSGAVPYVVPNVISHGADEGGSAAAGWADAALVIPWNLYVIYGDTRILGNQYESMKAWVEYIRREAGSEYLWTSGFHFGDWLAYATNQSDYPGATTDKDLVASCYFAHSTDLLQRTARILGKSEDAREYAGLLEKIKEAVVNEFVTPNGRLSSNTQTAYSLVLAFDLLPDNLRARAAERLAEDVRKFGHLTTGFLGTPLITHVLSRYGYLDEAYLLLNRKDYPSWLYPITKGATTIWERWDGIRPDGSFQDADMNSLNHYAYGAVGDWLYKNIAGINPDPAQPGYKHIIIAPRPGGNTHWAKGSLRTQYGLVESSWNRETNRFEISVPPNTRGTVRLPGARIAAVTESGKPVQNVEGIHKAEEREEALFLELGSGHYRFETAH